MIPSAAGQLLLKTNVHFEYHHLTCLTLEGWWLPGRLQVVESNSLLARPATKMAVLTEQIGLYILWLTRPFPISQTEPEGKVFGCLAPFCQLETQ